jgi:hypothetical protein
MPRCRCKLEVAICFTCPEWHFITSCWSTNYYAKIVHADFAQWTDDFDAIWSARRMRTVLPTPVADLCAGAVTSQRKRCIVFAQLAPKTQQNGVPPNPSQTPNATILPHLHNNGPKKRNLRPICNSRDPPATCTPLQDTAAPPPGFHP